MKRLFRKPNTLVCESQGCSFPATHIYGPECEAETGKLMYLCRDHAEHVRIWTLLHSGEPVTCPNHGEIGKVKNSVILKELK